VGHRHRPDLEPRGGARAPGPGGYVNRPNFEINQMATSKSALPAQTILQYVTEILREITADWDVGEISAASSLGQLGLESINLVYFIAEVQQHYDLRDALFNQLRADQTLLVDRSVGDIVDMVQAIRGLA
jgi:acyl carrier protein